MTVTIAPAGQPVALEALLTRPEAPGRYPLVVLSHGSPRDAAQRATTEPTAYSAVAIEFARRGWAVIAPLRRGYGKSAGPYVEASGPCANPDYVASGRASAADLIETIKVMARQDYVDPQRVLLAGLSAGGFGSIAAAAQRPPGVVAVLNFAGGRGSSAPDTVCSAARLVEAYAAFGRTIRIPTLWFYAANDHYFGPALARRFFAAFTDAGGTGEFVALPAFGSDGHLLLTADGMALWRDRVDGFLRQHDLPTWARPTAEPAPGLPPPRGLSANGRVDFEHYLAYPNFEKAFAVGGSHYQWVAGRRSAEEAARAALEGCRKRAGACEVYAINNALAR
jgi:dienelactone hydrolase